MPDSPRDPALDHSTAGDIARRSGAPVSAVQAFSHAWDDTLEFLFRPLDVSRWLWLSFICLFLGGGTSSAAFNWSLGSLSGDVGFERALGVARRYVFDHLWLIITTVTLGVALTLALLYLRTAFRFVLVDALVTRQVRLAAAWAKTRSLGRSYFGWLLATLVLVGLGLTSGALAVFPYLRSLAATGIRSLAFWVTLIALLLADIVVGLLLALIITLTDDLVVPVMYAEGLPLLPAWKKLWQSLRAEASGFAVYVLLRFGVAAAVGAAALLLLFPILVGLFSGAIIAGVLVVLGLRLLGVAWAWNPLTTALAFAALLLLTGIVLILLSVVGMPGQLLIQNFGIRFIGARVPALGVRLRREGGKADAD